MSPLFDQEAFMAIPLPAGRPSWGEPTWLYAMECAGFIKIGIASSVLKRHAGLQASNPLPVEPLKAYRIKYRQHAYWAEQAAFRALAEYRMHGEWFDVPQEAALAVVQHAKYAAGLLVRKHDRAEVRRVNENDRRYRTDPDFRAMCDELDARDTAFKQQLLERSEQ